MSPLFTENAGGGKRSRGTPPPPPPGAASSFFEDEPEPAQRPVSRKPVGLRFDAELDLTELDERDRPGPTWSGKGRELSKSCMSFRSRKMCYPGRRILAAVHLIDDTPVPLFGKVLACDYDGDGLYRVELELQRAPERPEIDAWVSARSRN